MARKKIESKSKTTTRTRKKTPVEILHPKKGEPDVKEIKHILQLCCFCHSAQRWQFYSFCPPFLNLKVIPKILSL